MARVAVLASGFELGVRMVCPDVCGFHSCLAVLAVGDGVARKTLHEVHLPHTAAGIFDKPESGVDFLDEVYNVGIDGVALSGVVCDRPEVAVRLFVAVEGNSHDGICCAVGACPYDIRDAAAHFDDLIFGECTDIRAEGRFKIFFPVHGVHFMSSCGKRFGDGFRAAEQFKHFHLCFSCCNIQNCGVSLFGVFVFVAIASVVRHIEGDGRRSGFCTLPLLDDITDIAASDAL